MWRASFRHCATSRRGGPERDVLSALALDSGVGDRVIFPGAIDERPRLRYSPNVRSSCCRRELRRTTSKDLASCYLEAGSYGKAVIGGANGGVAEAIAHEETGLLVDTRDAGELTAQCANSCETRRVPTRWPPRRRAGMPRLHVEDAGGRSRDVVDDLAEERRRETPPGMPSAVGRVRRHMGSASNRAFSAAEVLAVLARRGRLGTFLGRGIALTDREACAHATMAWVQRAIHAGGGDGASAPVPRDQWLGWRVSGDHWLPDLDAAPLRHRLARPELADSAVHAGEWLPHAVASGAICRNNGTRAIQRPASSTPPR